MFKSLFTDSDNWLNGFYILALALPSSPDAVTVLQQMATFPALDAWYLDRDKEPEDQPKVAASEPLPSGHLYGALTFPSGHRLPCGALVFRMYDDPGWVEFYIPLASVDQICHTGAYPFGDSAGYRDWQQKIDPTLVELARHVYEKVRFPVGIIQFEPDYEEMEELRMIEEVMGEVSAELNRENEKRNKGILRAAPGGIRFFPPNLGWREPEE